MSFNSAFTVPVKEFCAFWLMTPNMLWKSNTGGSRSCSSRSFKKGQRCVPVLHLLLSLFELRLQFSSDTLWPSECAWNSVAQAKLCTHVQPGPPTFLFSTTLVLSNILAYFAFFMIQGKKHHHLELTRHEHNHILHRKDPSCIWMAAVGVPDSWLVAQVETNIIQGYAGKMWRCHVSSIFSKKFRQSILSWRLPALCLVMLSGPQSFGACRNPRSLTVRITAWHLRHQPSLKWRPTAKKTQMAGSFHNFVHGRQWQSHRWMFMGRMFALASCRKSVGCGHEPKKARDSNWIISSHIPVFVWHHPRSHKFELSWSPEYLKSPITVTSQVAVNKTAWISKAFIFFLCRNYSDRRKKSRET